MNDPSSRGCGGVLRRSRWCHISSASLLGLTLTVGGAPPAGAQVEARSVSPSSVSCQILTADVMAIHPSVTSALQNEVLGIQLLISSGQVGSGASLRLRGNSTIAGSTEPLVYIDGVRMTERGTPGVPSGTGAIQILDLVDPRDVQRIEVLSGPAATALYGTQAVSGVIHVYTKRGTGGDDLGSVWYHCSG